MTTVDKDWPIVKLKLDVVFKRVFGNENNKEIIAAFLSALLEIPRNSIEEIYIDNVEMAPEYLEQKFSRLDLRLEVDGRIVNVEMQVTREDDFKERTLFYWAKMFGEELKSGQEYKDLKRTICINIINFNLFECEDYHSHFQILERERQEVLSDKFAIHFFELKKIDNVKKNQAMEDWLRLINAETEGDLMELQRTTTIPEVKNTIVMLRQLSADERVRREVFKREMRLHDEASAMGNERRKGKAEGRAEGRAEGIAEGRAEGETIGFAKGEAKKEHEIAERMREQGYTEAQIKALLGV